MEVALNGIFVLCYLFRENMVALAPKKRSFGKGMLNGYGGRIKDGETTEDAMIRELKEEAGINAVITDLTKSIELTVVRKRDGIEKRSIVDVFTLNKWTGNPQESDEMGLVEWFRTDQLPWKRMIKGDDKWLLYALFPNDRKIYRVELSYELQKGSKNPFTKECRETLEVFFLPPIMR